jgi:hypothetical protein
MLQYRGLGSDMVHKVRSLRKIRTRFHGTNLCINGTSSAPFCTEVRAVTERSKTSQNMSFGSNGVDRVRSKRKIPTRLHCMILVWPVLHWSSFSIETVRNTPKHEFGVHWRGLDAFVAKSSDATLLNELVH